MNHNPPKRLKLENEHFTEMFPQLENPKSERNIKLDKGFNILSDPIFGAYHEVTKI